MSHRDAYILLSLVALLWAGNFPASKIGLSELSPITLTMARAVLVTPVLLLMARLLEGPPPTLTRRDYKTFLVLSLTGSPALLADGRHLLADVVTSVGITIGVGLVVWGAIFWKSAM